MVANLMRRFNHRLRYVFQANHEGAMLSVTLPADVANMIALPDGEPPEDMHITLFYFGDASGIDSRLRHEIIYGALGVTDTFPRLSIVLQGTGIFENNDERPLFAQVVSPELERLRAAIAEIYDRLNIPYSKDHEYHPHVTLKYLGTAPDPKVEVNLTFTADEICARFGGAQVAIPLFKDIYSKHFARKPAGEKQRNATGGWERVTNLQQRALVRAYDEWSARIRKELTGLAQRGATIPEQYETFRNSLTQLEASLAEVSVRGAERAGRVAAGKLWDTPVVQRVVQAEKDIARRLVAESLVPNIHAHLLPTIAAGQALSAVALAQGFEPGRPMAAQYAGGAWVAIFKVQQGLGQEREAERVGQGLPIEPVRWVLDPAAEHCAHGADGFFGCPEIAGEYPGGWSTLPTVPAGRVSCRGNCRCRLEVFRDGQWRRGLYDG